MEEENKYLLEVRILSHGDYFAKFEATDLTTGEKYSQDLPKWIFGYTQDFITQHTRFVLLCPKPEGYFTVGWMTNIWGTRSWDPCVIYNMGPCEEQARNNDLYAY